MMKTYLLSAATALAASVLVASGAADANTLYFQINQNFDTGGQRQVFIFGEPGTTGTVTGASGFSQAFDLGADGFIVVTLPVNQELTPGVVQDRGFRIDANNPISGYLLNRRPQSTDMAFLINGDRLGTDYFTLGYQNIQPDQISVQATQDNTTVTFRRPDGTTTTQTLNAGQTFKLTATAQLTGTRVTADRPVAVFSGNRCTNVPSGVTACDHIVEQMPPTDALSTTYYLAQTPRTGTLGNVFRAVATQDGTEVRVNGAVVATLNTGQFFEGRVAGGIELTANNPILVGQYLIGQSQAGANTDPAMTIVPGRDQWLSSYVFSPPAGTANFPTDFVSIVIGTADISTLLLDGVGVDSGLFQPLSTTMFSFGNINVSDKTGPFTITAASPFQLLLSGFDSFDSYLTYGGAAFAPGASPPPEEPPPPPPPPPADVLFWDGDRAGNANNNVVDGGDGVLTRTSTNVTTANGAVNLALPVTPITLVFAGEPGAVEIDESQGPIRLRGLRFDIDGYRLFGDAVELVGPVSMIRVGDGTDEGADMVARIESVLTGQTQLRKTDLGTLVLTGANDYGGGTDVAAGTLVGNSGTFGTGGVTVAADATLVFDQAAAGMFMNGISGDGALVKRGSGTLVLLGENPLAGPTTVEAGRLDVVGDLGASAVTVGSGATLGGIGTVGATRIGAGGRVAPGLSIGTITVDGNFVQASGSTYDVELNAAGQSDRIIATGTATVESSTTLRVIRLGVQPLVLGTRYTVLTGQGGRTGSYSSLTGDTRVSQFISVVQELDANNVYLGVRQTSSFASAGRTPNQIAAASGADASGNGSLYTALAYLQTEAQAQAAFDAISGEIHASARGAALEDSRFVREAVLGRLAGMDERAVWMQAYGASGSFDGDGNAADARRRLGGVFLGIDVVRSEGFTAGLVTGVAGGTVQVRERASGANTEDAHLGAYAAFGSGGFGARVGLAQMWRKVDSRRRAEFPGFSQFLTARTDQELFQAFAELGYEAQLNGWTLEPFGSLAWVKVKTKDFRETGGSGALASPGRSDDYWVTQLGARASVSVGAAASLVGSVAWRHLGGDERTTPIPLAFASGPGFTVFGAPMARDAASLGLSLSGRIAPNAELDVGYSGVVGSDMSDHGGRAALRIRF